MGSTSIAASADDGGPTDPAGGATGNGDGSDAGSAGPADEGPSDESGTTGAPVVEPEPLAWYPCPTFTGGTGTDAECAEVMVPLDWADPEGQQIELFVKRLGGGNGSHQMWMLMGGPGGSGIGYEGQGSGLAQSDGLDIYLLDHRGTGRSSRLTCSAEGPATPGGTGIEAGKFSPCLDELVEQWGDGLGQFTTTNAARDLGFLIDSSLAEVGEQVVHVFGGSYGTYWAHRYLQIFPDQADGVSMLGVAAPGFDFRYWERDFNEASEGYLDACSEDPFCSSRLGPDAVVAAHDILDALDQGHCAEAGLDRPTLNAFFASRMSWYYYERVLVPAVLHRLDRCDPEDVAALQNAAPLMQNPTSFLDDPLTMAPLLGGHIRYGEMYKEPVPTAEELQAITDDAIFSFGPSASTLPVHALWPAYEPDEFVDGYAQTDTPVLMLEGEFDPNSPLEQAEVLGQMLNGDNQRFYSLPGGVHSWNSPMVGGGDCALSLWYDFINDPESEPYDCRVDMLPLDFGNDAALAQQYFGVGHLYDN
ncbi:MAG: alpha/beta fold hydrolase [Myxococcota bacterium]